MFLMNHRHRLRAQPPQPRKCPPSTKKAKTACVKHDDIRMIACRMLRDRPLRLSEYTLKRIRHARIVQNGSRSHQRIAHGLLLAATQAASGMKRSRAPLIRFIEHLEQFDLGYASLGKKKCGMACRFGRAAAAKYRDHELQQLLASRSCCPHHHFSKARVKMPKNYCLRV
jgi:hypothetical protein